MPIYEYRCEACDAVSEYFIGVGDDEKNPLQSVWRFWNEKGLFHLLCHRCFDFRLVLAHHSKRSVQSMKRI